MFVVNSYRAFLCMLDQEVIPYYDKHKMMPRILYVSGDNNPKDIRKVRAFMKKLNKRFPDGGGIKLCCTYCSTGNPEIKLLRCTGCKQVYYCSKRCQKADWNKGGHKHVCGASVTK